MPRLIEPRSTLRPARILVNNAGINIRKQPQEYTLEEWHKVLDTNLTSAFICTQAAYPHMVKAGGGKIINIGSMMSIFGALFAGRLCASKGGIVQMTRALADRLGQGQHPGERGAARLDRYRAHAQGAQAGAGPARARAGAHAGRPLGRRPRTSPASPCSWRARRPTSSPARPFRSTAAIRRRAELRMSRKSGNRFSEKDMRQSTNLKRIPIQLDRDRPQ